MAVFSLQPFYDERAMPTLFRFLVTLLMLFAIGYGSLYVLAVYFEPEQGEVRKPLPSIKIQK